MGAEVLRSVARTWDRLWFSRTSSQHYAVLRIAFGLAGLLYLVGFTPVSMYWPVNSVAPQPGGGIGLRAALQSAGYGTVAGWMLFVGLAAAFACMAAGVKSRWAVLACLLGTVAQKSWNVFPLTSAHDVLTATLFYLVWADTGATLSVDAWLARRRGTELAQTQYVWPLRLIRFQVALLYLNSGLWKLLAGAWQDGSAIYYATSQNIFHRFPWPIPEWADPILTAGAYATLLWEISFPVLVLNRRTRTLALVTGVLVHVGIWLSIEVGAFSLMILCTYLAFLDSSTIEVVVRRLSGHVSRHRRDLVSAPAAQ